MFTEPSLILQGFVEKELNILPAFHLTERTKSFFKRIFDIAKEAPPPNYKIIAKKLSLPNTPFPKGRLFDEFEIDTIKQHIINLNKKITEVQLIIGIRTYHLHFVLPHRSSLNIVGFVAKINMWLHVATQFSEATCSRTVHVYLYLTDLKKTLPTLYNQPICQEHVNTAFTTGCNESTEIIIFRREEWFKVFIHESFHNLGLDFNFSSNNQQLLKSIFPLQNSNCLLAETYCELMAEVFNILLSKDGMSFIERHLQIERKFSLFQTAKILDYFDLNYIELFEKTAQASQLRQNNYKETTEVFCYFILKSLLLYNCNEFFEWLDTNCNGGIKFNQQYVEKFIRELIIPTHNHPKYIKVVDKVQSIFDKPVKNIFLKNTLRMTAIEMKL